MEYKEIDKDIRELIKWINEETKYKTVFSCSSHPEKGIFKGYIGFDYTIETVMFLDKILDKLAKKFDLLVRLNDYFDVLYYDFSVKIFYNGYDEKMINLNVDFTNVYNYYKVAEKPVEDFNEIVDAFWKELHKIMKEEVKEL